jgi:bacterioferritin-associated ferredoxin
MLICLCRGLSERDLRGLVAAGLRSTEEISQSCGAGGDCGACLSTIDRLVDDVRIRAHAGGLVAVGSPA